MVDLSRFSQKKTYFLPIAEGWGQVLGRKFYKPKLEDGWYIVETIDGDANFQKATSLQVLKALQRKRPLRMYAFGGEGIPIVFDNLLRWGYGNTTRVHFLNLPTFEIARVYHWEDGRFYFYESDPTFQRKALQSLKEKFERGEGISGTRGITPEMGYLFLLASLGREVYRKLDGLNEFKLTSEERKKRMDEFKNSFAETLKKTIEDAGGIFVRTTKVNKDSFVVHWRLEKDGQLVKTVIKSDMRVLSAGFCLSGYDRAHSMSSIIQLAKQYEEDDPYDGLYITRS